MKRPRIEFWYDFASTYSYLAALRIADAAAAAEVEIAWKPFPLGPIFAVQEWRDSPFNIYPAKGRYMIRDMQRIAASRGLSFRMPIKFPANSTPAARIALALPEDLIGPFTHAVFTVQFADGADISDATTLDAVLTELAVQPAAARALSETPAIKDAYRENSRRAMELGLFGAPTFVTEDGELFWGDDRLDQAIGWARKTATAD